MDKEMEKEVLKQIAGIGGALEAVALNLKWLGNGDCTDHIGAIEGLGKSILDSTEQLTSSIDGLSNSIIEAAKIIAKSNVAIADVLHDKI